MPDRPLWAPWRIDYITGDRSGGCIFCAAVATPESDAARVVDRAARSLTMLNAYPYAPGHLMVAPHHHTGELDELDREEAAEVTWLAQRAVAALRRAMRPDGFNVGLNLGAVAGAGFADHLHLHVVPRWAGDTNFMPVLADAPVVPQALDRTRDVLLEAYRDLGSG